MNTKELSKLKEFIEEQKETGKTFIEIAEEFLEKNQDCSLGLQPLSMIVYEQMSRVEDPSAPNEIELNFDSEKSGDVYTVVDDCYIWESRTAGKIKLKVEDADKLFYEYSQFGLNLSQEEVRRKHNLTIQQWNSIKNTLRLFKASHIFSPHTANNTPKNELAKMMHEKIDMKYNDQNRLIEEECRKNTIKRYEQIIKKEQRDVFESTEFIHDFHSLIPEKEIVTIVNTPAKKCTSDEVVAIVADIHIGAKTEGLLTTPNYNSDVVNSRLKEVSDAINEKNAKSVTLCILGDLIESFTGLNHINSWQSMEFGAYGSKVVFQAVNVLSAFFDSISNLKNVKIIGGNHDRSTSDNKVDRRCTIATLVAGWLQEKYAKIYNIEYSDLVLTHDMPNTKIILGHGDKKILKKETLDANVLQFGDKEKMNIVFTGHLHSRGVNTDRAGLRWYRTPSIFSGNYYSEENGWNARPGFFIVEEKNQSAMVIDYPLSLNYNDMLKF